MKILILLFLLAFAACNSKTSKQKGADSSAAQSYNWSQEEQNEFLTGCTDSAKVKMDEAAAFAYCNCVLKQLKQSYPSMDSAAPALMNVQKAAEFVANCK